MARTRGERGPRRTWPQRVVIGLNIVIVLTTLVLAAGLGYANRKLDEVVRIDLPPDVVDPVPEDPGDPQNYLVVGTDSAERLDPDDAVNNDRENLGTLSDTIMLLRVDPQATQAQLLSFPRDLWVTIPGLGEQKLNAALAGGAETLIDTIRENFGVPVHHYIQMDFLGFQELVTAVDGVPMYFDKPLRDTNSGLHIPEAGCISLSPEQALAYARSRHLDYFEDGEWQDDGSSDLGRIARQQDFIRRALQRAIDKGARNPITLNALINAGLDSVEFDTGLSNDDVFALGRQFRSFDPDDLQTMALDTSYDFAGALSILRYEDTEANRIRLDIFRGVGEEAVPSVGGIDPASVSIRVENGSGVGGQATEVTDGLAFLGFDTSPGTGDAERFDFARTLVRYEAGNEALAQFVAQQLEAGADLEAVPDVGYGDVVVVTGADFAGVKATIAVPPTTTAPTDATATTTSTTTTLPVLPSTTQVGEVPLPPPPGVDCG